MFDMIHTKKNAAEMIPALPACTGSLLSLLLDFFLRLTTSFSPITYGEELAVDAKKPRGFPWWLIPADKAPKMINRCHGLPYIFLHMQFIRVG